MLVVCSVHVRKFSVNVRPGSSMCTHTNNGFSQQKQLYLTENIMKTEDICLYLLKIKMLFVHVTITDEQTKARKN